MLQLDFLAVGEETQSGDAILFQFFDGADHRTVVVDGGFTNTADQILAHLDTYYGGSHIDLVVSTHPDDDHIRGLVGVVQAADSVGTVWVHQPSLHGFAGSAEHKADLAEELADAALSRGATVREPFAGQQFTQAVVVAGPSEADYELWLGQEATPETHAMLAKSAAQEELVQGLLTKYGPALSVDPGETLDPGEGTTPRNQHSVILNVIVQDKRALLTGDAGVAALNAAADRLSTWELDSYFPWVFQLPHHGSRHNLSPQVLDRLLGGIGYFPNDEVYEAIVSVATKALDHPRGAVANAITRRGYKVYPTRGKTLHCNAGYSSRDGWGEAQVLGWLDESL
jgi:beta-lactamase superfamily II metal-dependent hydrolase